MKYIKTYEKIQKISKRFRKKDIHIGDYVIINDNYPEFTKYSNYINNNVGKIINITSIRDRTDIYVVQFDELTVDDVGAGFLDSYYNSSMRFTFDELKYISNDKADLEVKLAANKYNL